MHKIYLFYHINDKTFLSGAGIFITMIVVGVVSFTGPFTLNFHPFTRDVLFYLGAVVWVFLTFHKGSVTLYEALG